MDYLLGLLLWSGLGAALVGIAGHLRGRTSAGIILGILLGPLLGLVAVFVLTPNW